MTEPSRLWSLAPGLRPVAVPVLGSLSVAAKLNIAESALLFVCDALVDGLPRAAGSKRRMKISDRDMTILLAVKAALAATKGNSDDGG